MKNFVKRLILFSCCLSLSFLLFAPFVSVNAESSTYWITPLTRAEGSISENNYFYQSSGTAESRSIILKNGSSYNIYSISTASNISFYYHYDRDGAGGAPYRSSYIASGTTYYIYNLTTTWVYSLAMALSNSGYPTVNSSFTSENVYKYTYGDNAIDPAPPGPEYGNIADISYSTEIFGSGEECKNNIDVLKWNSVVDNHNNLLPSDAVVDIRAIPGNYTASDKQSLLTKVYTDLMLDYTNFATLSTVPASSGMKKYVWSDVISKFNPIYTFGNMASMIHGSEYWYKQGWIYEVRLRIPSEEYTGEWIGIRNLTSSGVQNSENVFNNNGLDSTLIQTINNVNTVNSTENNSYVTNNNYYYNDYPIPSSSSDLSTLSGPLEAILQAIKNLTGAIGDKLKEIFQWLFVYEFDIEDFEEAKQTMLDGSGAFGEILTHLDDMKATIDSKNGQTYVPILSWGNIYVMDEVMIPAGSFNLGNLIAEDPMRTFYILYQMIVSGYLYFALFRFVYKKIISMLRA